MIVGVISDTHNLIRPEALVALQGSERILHAGDICRQDVLDALETIGPVTAIQGNCDPMPWARAFPQTALLEIEGVSLFMIHQLAEMEIDPVAAGVQLVIYGHSHQPSIEEKRGVQYLNPGSAGPRRFHLPISVARLTIEQGQFRTELVTLVCG